MDTERREAPATEEGWYVLHDLRTVDWGAWRDAPDRERERALDEGIAYLTDCVDLADAEEGGSAVFAVTGHEADLLVVHLRPALADLDHLERAFERTEFAAYTERADSYVSVTEVSGYMSREYFREGETEDAGMASYIESRLEPDIPDVEHVSFYPMDKRRGPEHNWYDLPFEERAELMSGHGEIGREFAGRVTQIITGSVGMDDHEWGVTLFADDLTDIKELLYEMRFDPSSSRYAEFGPFHVGRRFPPADLPALLAGERVPSDDGSGTASGERAAGDAGATAAHGGSSSHQPDSGAADAGDGPAHGTDDARAHGDGRGAGGEHASATDDGGSGSAGTAGGPPTDDDSVGLLEDAEIESIEEHLVSMGVRLDNDWDGNHAIVFYADTDAEELADDVSGLKSNFAHYDTHVMTTVRAASGRTAVISIWRTISAADTAAGFLSELSGISQRLHGPVGEATDDGGSADDDASGAEDGVTGTDEDDDIRGELADLDVYAGQPHGEDVYAVVLYSEADPETLASETDALAENFDHYDTHGGTAVYEGEERSAVVSVWETADAADTAAGFLSELPGVVARAGEQSGFGTMGMFYTVESEHREEFVEKFESVGDLLADMEGHHDTELLVNRENEDDMFIASQWRSREDAMEFFRSDAFRDTVSWGREILADRPRHVFLA